MRETTERPEGVDAGTLKLVGREEETIYMAFRDLLDSEEHYQIMHQAANPYGDGFACRRIGNLIEGKEMVPFKPL